MSKARIIAKLVAAGHEDLAEELVTAANVMFTVLSYPGERNRYYLMTVRNGKRELYGPVKYKDFKTYAASAAKGMAAEAVDSKGRKLSQQSGIALMKAGIDIHVRGGSVEIINQSDELSKYGE